MTNGNIQLVIDLFYIATALLMIYPWAKNRYHWANLKIIKLFAAQGVLQPFIATQNPYLVGMSILIINFSFIYVTYGRRGNWWWNFLILVSALVCGLGIGMMPIYHLMHIDAMDPRRYLIYHDLVTNAIMAGTAAQAFLIIGATDGFRGVGQHIKSAWLRVSASGRRAAHRHSKTRRNNQK